MTAPQMSSYRVSFPTLPEQQKIADFLTAVDSKLQALKKKKAILEGLSLIIKQIKTILNRQGVVEICSSPGECFDPFLHEAAEVVHSEEHPDETILDVLQKGYKLKNKLLRPSLVRVCKNLKNQTKEVKENG